jgi:aminoglycoside phosphotransferase (APT) family kinase protein
LAPWLRRHLPGRPTDLQISPLAATGDSNEMWQIESASGCWILRAPPVIKNAPSAHDVQREYRILQALDRSTVPHARPITASPGGEPLGRPFYVMEHLRGFSPAEPMPEPFASSPAARTGLGVEAARALAELGRAPWRDLGLGDLGRPDGFLARQVRRWMGQLDSYKVRELDGLETVARWLEEKRPRGAEPAIMHGDYGLRNVMFAPEPPARVIAIIDWEMTTIGDPMLDLGLLLATWSHPADEILLTRSVTHLEGMDSRGEIAAAYQRDSGRSLEHLGYYMALSLLKLACIIEGSYARYLAGTSSFQAHREYETITPAIVRRALAISRGQWGIS